MPSSRVTTWPTPPPFRDEILDATAELPFRAESCAATEEEAMVYSVPATVTEVGALAEGATAVMRPAALRV